MPPAALRAVSLLPSATEMVFAVGRGDALVGVSHECDHPPEVARLPAVTSTRVRKLPTSRGIDADVRAVLADALAVYEVRTDVLARLAPDVIVTQDLCDVCAVSLPEVERAARAVLGADVRIVSLSPTRLADVKADVQRVGEALDARAGATRAVAEMERRIEAVRARAAALPRRPNVLTIEWLDPVMIGGTWMPELVELAGGRALVTQPGDHAPTLAPSELAALDPPPDVVVVKPCGFALARTRAELGALDALLAPLDWPAVKDGAVWLADGNAYFNRPGPRLADSLEILAACVHPAEFEDLARLHAGSFVRRSAAG